MKKFYLNRNDIQVLTRDGFLEEHKDAPFPPELFMVKIDCVKDNAPCPCGRCNPNCGNSAAFISCDTRTKAESRQQLLQCYVNRFRVRSRQHEVNAMFDALQGRRPQVDVTATIQRVLFYILTGALIGTLALL